MASTWGNSWGVSWANSWGAISNIGVAGTISVGSFSNSLDKAISGVSNTGMVGTITTSGPQSYTITGVSASGAVGTLVQAFGAMPTGNYRHSVPAPIKAQRPQRLKTLERIYQRMERKS